MKLGLIVEGHGDALALPTLVRRIAGEILHLPTVLIQEPAFRVKRGRFAERFDDYERALQLLSVNVDGILVVLDSDDDDPDELMQNLQTRALACVGHRPVRVAPAVREFEAWFLASLEELAGIEGITDTPERIDEPESVRGAKGVFERNLDSRTYSESVDQKRYCRVISIRNALRNSPSFGRLVAHVTDLLAPPSLVEEDEEID